MANTKSRTQAKRDAKLDEPNATPNENPEQFFTRDPVHAVPADFDKAADVAPVMPVIEPPKPRADKGPKHKLTGVHTHVAVRHGQADGRIIAPGEYVPAGIPVAHVQGEEEVTHRDGKTETVPMSGGWMAEAPKE